MTLSTPKVCVTRNPGYISSDPSTSPADTIDLHETDIVPEIQCAMNVIFQDYLEIVNLLCHTPRSSEVGIRRIRRAVAAAADGQSPTEYAALSEDAKDDLVKKILGERQPNDGQWPSLLLYLGDRMAGTLGMSPSVFGEMRLCELASNQSPATEWWSPCWNDDSFQWPTDLAWTVRSRSPHTGYLYLCGGYAVHLAKHQVDQHDSIRVHTRISMLHELVHQMRSFQCGRNSKNCTPEKCVDTPNGPEAGTGIGEAGRCFEQIAFGCVVDFYSGTQRSCLLTKDYDSMSDEVYEISRQLSRKFLDPSDERPPINLPSQGGPPMPLFQHPPPSSFPYISHKNSFTTSTTIPTSPPRPPSTQSTSTQSHNGLIPLSGEFLDRAQAYYKSRRGLHCLRARRMGKAAMVNSMDN